MSDLERRAVLGLAGIVGVAAMAKMAKGGPLSPPAGAPVSTGRTTDEIFNKIPAGGAGDGRTAILGGTSTVTITQPGSYVLIGNITVASGDAIVIAASDVTLDLNGFTVTASDTTSTCVTSAIPARSNVTIRNGTVIGGSVGVGGAYTLGLLLEDIKIMSAKRNGISLASVAVPVVVRRCQILDTGSTTTLADGSLSVTALTYSGSGARIEDCLISRMFYNGSGSSILRGFYLTGGSGNVIARCTFTHPSPITASGIVMVGGGVYRDNTVINASAPYTGGTNGGGNV